MIARRPAVPGDAEAIARVVAEGFASFLDFAPPGWTPPERATPENVEAVRGRLWAPGAWAEVAEADGAVVGVSSFEPARPGATDAAYLIHVFVRRAWWGQGLASTLLADATEAAVAAGYREMWLTTPAGQARARRFYAREGWIQDGGPEPSPRLGMAVVRLKRPLAPRRA